MKIDQIAAPLSFQHDRSGSSGSLREGFPHVDIAQRGQLPVPDVRLSSGYDSSSPVSRTNGSILNRGSVRSSQRFAVNDDYDDDSEDEDEFIDGSTPGEDEDDDSYSAGEFGNFTGAPPTGIDDTANGTNVSLYPILNIFHDSYVIMNYYRECAIIPDFRLYGNSDIEGLRDRQS